MTRLMVMWDSPGTLSPSEIESWVTQELLVLLSDGGLPPVTVTRLGGSADSFPCHNWLLEAEFATREEALATLHSRGLRELAADLTFLGMRPTVVVADSSNSIRLPG